MSAVCTGRPVSASNVMAPMNSDADRVRTTSTAAPACVSRRAIQADLYAAIPPVTPSRMRRSSKGRVTSTLATLSPLGSPLRHDAVLNLAARQLLERTGGQLLLARRRAIARELIQHAGELRRHENAEILVTGVLGDFQRGVHSHDLRCPG